MIPISTVRGPFDYQAIYNLELAFVRNIFQNGDLFTLIDMLKYSFWQPDHCFQFKYVCKNIQRGSCIILSLPGKFAHLNVLSIRSFDCMALRSFHTPQRYGFRSNVIRPPWVGVQCVIVAFPGHTHLLFHMILLSLISKIHTVCKSFDIGRALL